MSRCLQVQSVRSSKDGVVENERSEQSPNNVMYEPMILSLSRFGEILFLMLARLLLCKATKLEEVEGCGWIKLIKTGTLRSDCTKR